MSMTITHKTVLGADGQPEAALIPWDEFIALTQPEELDLTPLEEKELREALNDSKVNNREAFIPADQV